MDDLREELMHAVTVSWATAKDIIGERDWNTSIGILFELARDGSIEKSQGEGGWSFRLKPDVAPEPGWWFFKPPEWSPECGTIENVWDRRAVYGPGKPPRLGLRVAWSIGWIDGAFPPPVVEDMDEAVLRAELGDYAARGNLDAGLLYARDTPVRDLAQWIREHGRVSRTEAVGPWMLGSRLGGRIMFAQFPRGWAPPPLPEGQRLAHHSNGGWNIVDEHDHIVLRLSEKLELPPVSSAEERFARDACKRAWQDMYGVKL